MSYTDLHDFDAEYTYTAPSGTIVQIAKLGGGTVGREYSGRWRYIVTDNNGTEIARGQDYDTPMPHTHKRAAIELLIFFPGEGDE